MKAKRIKSKKVLCKFLRLYCTVAEAEMKIGEFVQERIDEGWTLLSHAMIAPGGGEVVISFIFIRNL